MHEIFLFLFEKGKQICFPLFFFCQFVNIKRRDHLLKKMVGVFPFLYRRKNTEAHGVSRVYFILYM